MGRQKHEVVIKMEAQWETHLIVNNHFIYSYYLIIFYEIWCMQLNQEMQITRDLCMQFRVIQKACDITIFWQNISIYYKLYKLWTAFDSNVVMGRDVWLLLWTTTYTHIHGRDHTLSLSLPQSFINPPFHSTTNSQSHQTKNSLFLIFFNHTKSLPHLHFHYFNHLQVQLPYSLWIFFTNFLYFSYSITSQTCTT